MKNKLNALKDEAGLSIQKAVTLQEMDEIRIKYLGKKGEFTEISKSMRELSPEERPAFGQMVNDVKTIITTLIEEKTIEIRNKVKKEQ